MSNLLKRTLSLVIALVMVLGLLPVTSLAAAGDYTKATSIVVGDTVLLACENKTVELSSISTTSTKYGVGTAYTGAPAGLMPLTVVNGNAAGTVAFQTSDGNYLYWSSGNSLTVNAALSANSSWTVSFDVDGNAIILNAQDSTRKLQWNASSPRFACYTSAQTAVQLYKAAEVESDCDHSTTTIVNVTEATCTTNGYTGDTVCANADCGKTIAAGTVIPALDHTYDGVDGCANCDAVAYYKVTNVSQLADGAQVIIAVADESYNLAMSTTQNNNNRGTVSITKSGDVALFGSNTQILTLQKDEETGYWALYTGNGYLYAASDSANHLKTQDDVDENALWEIAIEDGSTSVIAKNSSNRNIMRYNQGNNFFSCYQESYYTQVKAVVLYANALHECEHVNTHETEKVSPSCTEKGYTAGTYCDDCDTYIEGHKVIPAKGHSYVIGETTVTCENCDLSETLTSLADAAALAEDETYDGSDIYVTGTITEISNTTYGNAYITDGENNLYIYGIDDVDGNRYDAMDPQPGVGDTVVLVGNMTVYETTIEMADAVMIGYIPAPTCEHEYMYACDQTCAICGELTNPDAAHTVEHVAAVEATCTAYGNIEYWYCTICGSVWTDEARTQTSNMMSVKLPMAEHEYFYACDQYCMNCYELTNPDAAHTIEKVEAKAATCYEEGNIEYWYCTICGSAWTDEACTQVTNQMSVKLPKLEAVAQVGEDLYASLAEAIAVGGEVTLLTDVELTETLNVTGTVVLDLNGHVISMEDASGAAAQAVKNSGNLTIKDSGENGKITFVSTTPSASNSYSTSTIINIGTLTVESGIIENTTTSGPSYAIDNAWYTQDVTLNVKGGTITAVKIAVRQVPFSTEYENVVNVTGGTLTGASAGLQTHNYSSSATLAEVNISGGTFNGTYAYYTYYSYANIGTGTTIDITGGTFNGYLFLYNGTAGSSEYPMNVSVSGGTFNGGAYIYTKDADGNEVGIPAISGGTYSAAVDAAYCAEGFIPTENGDGTYGVKAGTYVAEVNGVKYESLADAIAAGGEVTVLTDIELTAPITVAADQTVVLNLNGKTVSYTSTIQGEAMITNKGNLTINDTEDGVINYNYTGAADSTYSKGNYTISNEGTLTVNGGKITIANLRAHAKYPINNNSTSSDAILVINGGHLYNYNTAAIRLFCNSTTYQNSVTINGGTIEGYCAIWMQNPGSRTVNGQLSITGGEIRTTAAAYVNGTSELKDVSSKLYCTTEGGAWSEGSSVSITGGIINENVYLAEEAPASLNVEGDATFNGNLELPVVYVAQVGETKYESLAEAVAAANDGDTVTLLADVQLDATLTISKAITIDGNGKKVTTSDAFVGNASNAMIDIQKDITFNNVVFDGVENVAVMRAVSVNVVMDDCVVQNCEHTVDQGLLRLACSNATITDSKFLNNDCTMVVSFGYDAANDTDVMIIDNCVFEDNTCGGTAVVYFADGDYGKVTNTKFIDNTVTTTGNAATLYLGWGDGFEVSGCLFDGNKVTTSHATTKRFASAIFCDGCEVTGNAFGDNTATRNGETISTVVAVGAYYGAADVSENYWIDGSKPVKGEVFTVEYTRNPVVIDTYYTESSVDAEGNVTLAGLKKMPAGKVAYRGYINDSDDREAVQIDLENVFAENSFVIKLYDANGNLLTTTTYRNGGVDAASFTCNIVLWGRASGSWDTVINAEKLTVANVPTKAEVWSDGELIDTFDPILGTKTDAAAYQLPAYLALDCVYKEAKIGDTYYATLEEAVAAAQVGDTIVLLVPVVVNAGETLTLDKAVTITYTSNVPGEDMITNKGNLVIDGATLVYTNTDTTASNVTVSTISCEPGSTLEVKSGVVKNDSANNAASGIYAYAIDLVTNGNLGDVTATISGGEVISTNYMAIRQFVNGEVCKNTLTVTGGSIKGATRGINIQLKNNMAYTTISGGTIEGGAYSICFLTTSENLTVSGGVFKGDVWYSGTDGFISGGTFDKPVEEAYCAEGYIPVDNGDGTYGVKLGTYVAQIGETKYETLAEAVEAAEDGETVIVLANISDAAITVSKNLTITGSVDVVMNNVSITGSNDADLTVSNLTFTGNSWINSGSASKLTVSGVTATDVAPVNGSGTANNATNSRAGFIALGSSEQNELVLVIENCNIVVNNGGDPVIGWASITEATITGNTFGSADHYQTNSDSVKIMSIAKGAVITVTGNTVYSNYNGFVFAQNTTRDNAYTVIVEDNDFYGGADHIWVETSGANYTNATVKATSGNTVNDKAFTAADIKTSVGTWYSYAGVDVVTDENGKIIGGTLASFSSTDAVAEGYIATKNEDGTYTVSACEHEYDNACDVDCNICGENREVEHNVVAVEAKAATCTEEGNIAYWYCDVCGACWDNAECTGMPLNRMMVIVPAAHTYTDNCDTWCDVCDEYRWDAPHGGLTHVEAVVPATCQEVGCREYWICQDCGAYFGDAEASYEVNPAWMSYYGEHSYVYGACEHCGEENYTYTVYFENNWLWTDVRAYIWFEDGTPAVAWPGAAMELYGTANGNDLYVVQVPYDAVGLIFNGTNPEGLFDKTPDIEGGWNDGIVYYMEWNGSNEAKTYDMSTTFVAKDDKNNMYTTLSAAVAGVEEGGTIYMMNSVELSSFLTINKSLTLDLCGCSITRTDGTALYINAPGAVVNLQGGTVNGGMVAVWVAGGTVNINDGYYYELGNSPAVYAAGDGVVVNIYGGEFSTAEMYGNQYWVLNIQDDKNAEINVYGGYYANFDPANNLSEGANTNFVAQCHVSAYDEWFGMYYVYAAHEYMYECDAHCKNCGELTNEWAEHYIIHVDAVEATCFENGNLEYWYCEYCNTAWTDEALEQQTNLKNVVTPAAHAELTHVEAVAPTCFENGNLEYWWCETCGYAWLDAEGVQSTNLKAVVLPAAHAELTHVEAKEATCTETGNLEYWWCETCGYAWLDAEGVQSTNLKAVVLPMAEHTYLYACDQYCYECGELTNPDATHTIVHVDAVEATCQALGNIEYWYCSDCGAVWTDEALTRTSNMMSVKTYKDHEYFYACDQYCMNCYELTNPDATHSVVHVDAVAGDCLTMGNIEYWYCEYCGTCWDNAECTGMPLNQMSVKTGYGDHNYENGTCTVCSAREPFDIDGANMTLGNSLAMNFYILPSDLVEGETYYAVITKEYADGRDAVTVTVEQEDWTWHEGYQEWYVSFNGVAAKEMTDTITVVIYNSNDEAVSNVWVDSVQAYTMRVLLKEEAKASPNAEKLTLYVDMLNYGAAAQVEFGYNTDNLANNQLTEAQAAYATSDDIELTDNRVKGEGYSATSLTLESDITMNFFFLASAIPTEHDDYYAIATWTDHYGNAKEVRVEGEDFAQLTNDTDWYVAVKGVVVADARQLVTVTVYNAAGEAVATGADSIESYVARNMSKKPIYLAIMKFCVSAYESFHQ